MAGEVTSYFMPQNLLDMVPADQAQAAATQARNTFLFGLLSGDIGSAYNNAQNQGYNVLNHAAQLAEKRRAMAEQAQAEQILADARETVPGTGVGTSDPLFAPRDKYGNVVAGPGYIPPVNQLNWGKVLANPNAPLAAKYLKDAQMLFAPEYGEYQGQIYNKRDPNLGGTVLRNMQNINGRLVDLNQAQNGDVLPNIQNVNGMIVDLNNIRPGTFIPQVDKNQNLGVDAKGNFVTNVLPGAPKAVSTLKGAEAQAQEAAKAANDLVDVALPDGRTVKVTRAQAVGMTNQSQPLTSAISPAMKMEGENYGQFLIKNVLTPAKERADAAQKANSNLAMLEQTLKNAPVNQITNTEGVQRVAGYLKAAGMLTPEAAAGVTQLSQLRGLMSASVLEDQLAQKGPQTEADAKRMTETISAMGDKEATQFLVSAKKAQNQRNVEYYQFLDKYRAKTGSLDGADNEWAATRGKESIYRTPDMKRYAPIYELNGKKYRVFGDGGPTELVN